MSTSLSLAGALPFSLSPADQEAQDPASDLPLPGRPPDADLSATSQAEAAGLSAELLTEVRWLTHLATTQDERATEDDWRLLALLLRSAGFNKALSPLAPRAQLDALSFLQIDCKAAGQLLASQSVDLHPATNSGPDAAGLVLHGSLQLLGAAPGQEQELPCGSDIPYGRTLRTAVGAQGAELLRLPHRGIQEAIAIEERRATRRRDAAEALKSSAILCRGQCELQAIRSYLDLIPLFHGMESESLLRLCQHLQLLHVPMGGRLVKSGTSPDGFRILLHGTAAVSTCEGNRCLPLRCIEAWFCEDEPLEPWELCLTSSAGFRRPRDIVALSESCDVIFLPRAESGVICDALRDGSELRRAALKALVVKSRSEDEAIQPRSALLCDCPLLQAQDNYWRSLARKRRSEAMEKMQLADAKLPSPSASLARPLGAGQSRRTSGSGSQLSRSSSRAGHDQLARESPPGDIDHPPTHSRSGRAQQSGSLPGGAASFWSGTQLVCWYRTPSPSEEDEEDEAECLRQSYLAAQSWAEELAGALVEGLLALSPSISNSSLRLLPRRGRRELCRQTELWRTARGEVLRGERSENVMVILRGQVGVLEKDPELDDLPPAILQGLGATAARLFRSADVPVTEQVQTWLQTISSEEAMGSSMPLVDGADSSQRDLAASLLETMIYRYKEIFPPSQHGIPQFLKSAFLDQTFLGDNAYWVVKDQGGLHKDGSEGQSSRPWADSLVVQMDTFRKGKAKYLDISAAGHLRQVLSPGDLLLGAGQQTLVAIEPRTDILMMDPSALSTWLEEIAADTFFAPALADGLQKRAGSQLAAKDFAQLSQLLLRYEIFENLENRSLRDICRSTQFVCIDQGELICQAGQKSSAFIQILSGSAVAILPSGEQQQLPQGSAIGEDVLLGLQEHWPFSLRADTDVKLAWLQASAFKEASMDLSGEAAARRRVLEALGNRPTDLSDQDPELLHSVFKVPVLQQLDYDQRLEVAKEATLHRISKGGTVDLPKGDSLPFFVVLKGVVGRYEADVTASPTSVAEESQEASCEQEDTLRAQEEQREKLRLEKDTAELTELQQRLRLRPLDVSLQDRLRYHSLKIQVDQLREELANQDAQVGLQEVLAHQEPDVEPIEQPPQSSVPSRESFAAPILQQAANMSAARHSGVFLTMINPGDADAASVTSETAEDMNDVLAEFAEGDFFGGWFTSVGPSLYRAHKDSVLLSISEAAWNDALQRCAVIRRAARGKLLRESFACDDETAEKLLPLFKEETRRKGCVLVKAGQVSSSLWLIAGGRCSQAAAAPKPIHEEWPANEENQTGKRVGTPKTKRRFFSSTVELGLLEAGQLVGLTSVALQQPEPLTVTTASPEVKLLRADNLPQAKLTPKVLEALRSALRAKATWLGQRLESLSELPAKLSRKAEKMHAELERAKIPLVVDSPFLRRRHQALLPGMVALEAVCKHFGDEVHPESEWIFMHQERDFFMHMHLSHEERESRILTKASQDSDVAPRPVSKSTMEANARFGHHRPLLWKTFRMKDEVLLAQESSAFSKPMQETVLRVADASSAVGKELVPAAPATPAAHEPRGPETKTPPDRAKKTVTFSDLKEATTSSQMEDVQVSEPPPRTSAAPGDAFKRRPQIKLRSNSRTFQMSGTEVDINEKRAMKEAKLKASYAASREPLVTPRDSPGGHRSTARQRAALVRHAVASAPSRLGRDTKSLDEPDGTGKDTEMARELIEVVLPRLPLESASCTSSLSGSPSMWKDASPWSGPARRPSGDESELSVTPQVSVNGY